MFITRKLPTRSIALSPSIPGMKTRWWPQLLQACEYIFRSAAPINVGYVITIRCIFSIHALSARVLICSTPSERQFITYQWDGSVWSLDVRRQQAYCTSVVSDAHYSSVKSPTRSIPLNPTNPPGTNQHHMVTILTAIARTHFQECLWMGVCHSNQIIFNIHTLSVRVLICSGERQFITYQWDESACSLDGRRQQAITHQWYQMLITRLWNHLAAPQH